jgi:uncharacterized membrane protein YciS (DUF1049 family)
MEHHNSSWWGFPVGLGTSILAAALSWAGSFELWLRLAVLFVGFISAVLTAWHFWIRVKRDNLALQMETIQLERESASAKLKQLRLKSQLERNGIKPKDDTTR